MWQMQGVEGTFIYFGNGYTTYNEIILYRVNYGNTPLSEAT